MAEGRVFIEVQKYLGGVDYPADRDELVRYAQEQGAPDDVVEALSGLDDRAYADPTEVSEAVT
jgi:hypothetical protein